MYGDRTVRSPNHTVLSISPKYELHHGLKNSQHSNKKMWQCQRCQLDRLSVYGKRSVLSFGFESLNIIHTITIGYPDFGCHKCQVGLVNPTKRPRFNLIPENNTLQLTTFIDRFNSFYRVISK